MTAKELIQKLKLTPLPEEGGYYRETYRSDLRFENSRDVSTAIYYLVIPESFSALHKVKSDEIFHFYSGDPVEMIQLDESGKLQTFTIGSDVLNHTQQVVVPRGVWQGLRLKKGGEWALMGTTVAPGFEFEDFEVGSREKLIAQFPQHREPITKFTRAAGEAIHGG